MRILLAVVMVLHELNHAARYADHLVVMSSGQVVAEGTPEQVARNTNSHTGRFLAEVLAERPVPAGAAR